MFFLPPFIHFLYFLPYPFSSSLSHLILSPFLYFVLLFRSLLIVFLLLLLTPFSAVLSKLLFLLPCCSHPLSFSFSSPIFPLPIFSLSCSSLQSLLPALLSLHPFTPPILSFCLERSLSSLLQSSLPELLLKSPSSNPLSSSRNGSRSSPFYLTLHFFYPLILFAP